MFERLCYYSVIYFLQIFSHSYFPQFTVTISTSSVPKDVMDEATCVHFVVEGRRVFAQAILDGRSIYFNALLSNANISCSEPVNAF